MDMKFFSDLIDALAKVVDGLKALVNLPKAERDKYREAMDETCRLIDTTLNMVIIKLGDISYEAADTDLLREVARLDNYTDWMTAEREFQLCRNLRVAVREAETLQSRLIGTVIANDWDALLRQMQAVLASEGQIASFIGDQFSTLSNTARTSSPDIRVLRDNLRAVRTALISQRQKLIQREMELMTLV